MNSEPSLTRKELLAALPNSLAYMATRIPVESVLELVTRYGGARLFVPGTARASSELTRVIGLSVARKLSATYGGETITVARAVRVTRATRNKAICEERRKGCSIDKLARQFQLTSRCIRNILKDECLKRKQNDE